MKKLSNLKSNLAFVIYLLPVVFGIVSCGNDQKPEDTKNVAEEHNTAKFNNTDKEKDAQFLVNAAEINLQEIQLGQLAQKNGERADVKELGKAMETEHTRSLNELKDLAAKKVITIPTAITDDGQAAYKKLSSKSGLDFDKEYCDMMVNGHKDVISKFEKASKDCVDGDIKAWAAATIPALQGHLDHALNCQKKCNKM